VNQFCPREDGRVPVGDVLRIERLIGGDPITEDLVLRFIAKRWSARSLVFLKPKVAREIAKRPKDFLDHVKAHFAPVLGF